MKTDTVDKYCNEYTHENEVDCSHCHGKYNMPYSCCCLIECGEHQFCSGCTQGIYMKSITEKN